MILAVTKTSAGARPLAALVAALAMTACAGENLFTAVGVGDNEPEVEITEPAEGATVETGASLAVSATALAQVGGASVQYKGIYEDDLTAAYATQTAALNGLVSLSLNATVVPSPGQTEGSAKIIVTVTDQTGGVGADTVTVTIVTANE